MSQRPTERAICRKLILLAGIGCWWLLVGCGSSADKYHHYKPPVAYQLPFPADELVPRAEENGFAILPPDSSSEDGHLKSYSLLIDYDYYVLFRLDSTRGAQRPLLLLETFVNAGDNRLPKTEARQKFESYFIEPLGGEKLQRKE